MKDAELGKKKKYVFRQMSCKESHIGWGSGEGKEMCFGKLTHSAAAV